SHQEGAIAVWAAFAGPAHGVGALTGRDRSSPCDLITSGRCGDPFQIRQLAVQAVAILETGDMARGSRTDERLENELSQEPSLGSSSLVVERNDLVAIGVDNSRHSHPFFILSGFTSRWIGPVLSLGGHANELRTA